jgi:hypothetical protein
MLKYEWKLSDELMNVVTLFVTISLVAIIGVIGGNSMFIMPTVYAQDNNLSSSALSPQLQNTTTTTTTNTTSAEEKTYILIFGQRTIGNIDNSTKIISSIVGNDSIKMQEEFVEEISLAPSQQLEEQINKIVNDGISGLPCSGVSLTTQEGESVSVDCISLGNKVIWYVYPTP